MSRWLQSPCAARACLAAYLAVVPVVASPLLGRDESLIVADVHAARPRLGRRWIAAPGPSKRELSVAARPTCVSSPPCTVLSASAGPSSRNSRRSDDDAIDGKRFSVTDAQVVRCSCTTTSPSCCRCRRSASFTTASAPERGEVLVPDVRPSSSSVSASRSWPWRGGQAGLGCPRAAGRRSPSRKKARSTPRSSGAGLRAAAPPAPPRCRPAPHGVASPDVAPRHHLRQLQ